MQRAGPAPVYYTRFGNGKAAGSPAGSLPAPRPSSALTWRPVLSFPCNYWAPTQDTCVAECRAEWVFDDERRKMVWDLFANGPAPVGYDPAMIPGWENALSPTFAALKLDPWRLRVMPGTALMQGTFEAQSWQEQQG